MIGRVAVLIGVMVAGSAIATAPEASLRPNARPAPVHHSDAQDVPPVRPVARAQSGAVPVLASAQSGALVPAIDVPARRPVTRPEAIVEQVLFNRRALRKTSVCGDIDIQGEPVGTVTGNLPGCGAKSAVRVTSVSGVRLSTPSVMHCDLAKSLNRWVSKDVEKAFGRGNKVVSLRVAAHYACRSRNNRPGARISEHGKARAIDISGFTLEDGQTVTVLEGWKKRQTRKKLRKIWKAACGPFGTVLGPDADRYHQDHFHLDMARHRGGAYCR
jgi:hypothetical protein